MPRSKADRPTVGWREWVALPQLRIAAVKVKVDTGARTSALHAFNLRPFKQNGELWVRFDVHPVQRSDATVHSCVCPVRGYRWVVNSGGGREKRFVIETPVRIGEQEWPIEVTLADRDQMGFRMLLGRTAIKSRFVVDPALSYCTKSAPRRKKRSGRTAMKSNLAPRQEEE